MSWIVLGPGPGLMSLVKHRFGSVSEYFLDRTQSMCSIGLLFLFISCKPYFTSATKKESD